MSSGASQLIDDTNTHVQYRAGWIWDQGVAEVHGTRHGAQKAGLQASLSFVGTGIRVIGTLGASDVYGQPKTTYSIDGTAVGTYNAPLTPSGETHYNTTFFSTQDLSPGDHTITIENMDGTSPNTFWLDYFLIDSGSPGVTVNPDTSTILTSPASSIYVQQTTRTTIGAQSLTTSVSPSPTVSDTSDPSRTARSRTGVIAGATAGAVIMVLLAFAFFCLRRRRRRTLYVSQATMAPFTPIRDPLMTLSPNRRSPTMRDITDSPSMLSHGAGALESNSDHRLSTTPLYKAAPGSEIAGSQSEPRIPHALTGGPIPAHPRRTASVASVPSTPVAHPPTFVPEKTPWWSFSNSRRSPRSSTQSNAGASQTAHPLTLSSDTDVVSLRPPAVLPPGVWHAPTDAHGRAYSLLRSLFSQRSRASLRSNNSSTAPRAVDSGLRLYDDVLRPPPYTED